MTGRFVSEDPYIGNMESPVSQHRFLYANGGPVNGVDPTGNFSMAEMATVNSIVGIFNSMGMNTMRGTIEKNLTSLAGSEMAQTYRIAFMAMDVWDAATLAVTGAGVGYGAYKLGSYLLKSNVMSKAIRKLTLKRMQSKAIDALGQGTGSLQSAFPSAKIGFRGSLARGTKGPHKGNAPFDPDDFDIDAFVVSDELAGLFGKGSKWRDLDQIDEFRDVAANIEEQYSKMFQGMRKSPADPFKIRVWTEAEFQMKVGADERIFLN